MDAAADVLLELPASSKMVAKGREHRHLSSPKMPPPQGLGFFTLHTDLPHELNARTLSETLERYRQKSKLRLRHLMWPLLMLHQSFQNQGSEEIPIQCGDVTLLREKFHVTINLSKSQEARKVVSAICIHLNAKHKKTCTFPSKHNAPLTKHPCF